MAVPMEFSEHITTKQFAGELHDSDEEIVDITSLGEGLRIISDEKVNLNHKLATTILELKEFDGERLLRDHHVTYLIQAMERKTFRPEWVKIISCICKEDGVEYRMNGQHTCWARLHVVSDHKCPVQFIKYEAQTNHDMRILYSSIDRNAPRTKANVINSYIAGTKEYEGISQGTIKTLSEGLAFWLWESPDERKTKDGDVISYLMKTEHYALCLSVAKFYLTHKGIKHLRRRPVSAALHGTFNKAIQKAEEFWDIVATGVGITETGDPRLKLRNSLLQSSVDTGGGSRTQRKKVTAEEMYRWCIYAWNAWRRDEKLQLLKAPMSLNRPTIK